MGFESWLNAITCCIWISTGPWSASRRGLWEVHYDPYDATHVFVRTPDGWVTAPTTYLPMVAAPFAEFTWRHATPAAWPPRCAWMTRTRPRWHGC